MKHEVDSETQEIFDHMAEDLAKSRKDNPSPVRRQRNSSGSTPAMKFSFLVGLGAAILILLVITLFRGGGKQDITPLQDRLDQVERKLALLESHAGKAEAMEEQLRSLQQGQARLEASGKTFAERLERVSRQAEKAQASPAAPRAAAPAKARVHDVRPGDTLFGIAAGYGITLDQLLRANNLSRSATIQPGQKLLIPPERP